MQAQKQIQAQQAAEEACHLDATAQRLQAEAHMVATSAQAASAAASLAQGAHHSEPQPYASQAAARSAAMMRNLTKRAAAAAGCMPTNAVRSSAQAAAPG